MQVQLGGASGLVSCVETVYIMHHTHARRPPQKHTYSRRSIAAWHMEVVGANQLTLSQPTKHDGATSAIKLVRVHCSLHVMRVP